MLMDFQKYEVSVMEYILMGWVGVLILEEIRQVRVSSCVMGYCVYAGRH